MERKYLPIKIKGNLMNTIISRRTVLASLAAAAFMPKAAWSQAVSQLTLVAPGSVGGGFDAAARSLGSAMQSEGVLGSLEVINAPGAGGTIGLAQFVERYKGRPDAALLTGGTMINSTLTNKLSVSLADTRPLALLFALSNVIVVPASSQYADMKALAADLKASPATVSFAGGSVGGTEHMAAALIAADAGLDPKQLKYIAFSGGGEVTAAVLGGHVSAAVTGWNEVKEQVRAGQLRALALTSGEPIKGVDVPTLKAQGINVEILSWSGITAAGGISDADYQVLLDTVTKTVQGPAWQKVVETNAWLPNFIVGPQFEAYIRDQMALMKDTLGKLGLL